jgi:hypothetical protein
MSEKLLLDIEMQANFPELNPPISPKISSQTKHFPISCTQKPSHTTKYRKKQKVEKTFNFPVFIKIHSVWQMDKTEKMITEIMKEKKI